MLWNLTTEIVVTIIFGTAFVCASVAGCICTTVNPADNFVVSCNTEGHEDKVSASSTTFLLVPREHVSFTIT